MDDDMVNRERTCKLVLRINSYGSLEHLEKTIKHFFKEMALQGFSFDVESLDMGDSVVEETKPEEVKSSEEPEFDYGAPIPVRVFFGISKTQLNQENISKVSSGLYRYEASAPEFDLFLVHYSRGGINAPKAYLRREGSLYFLTLHQSNPLYSGDDPRGEIVSQIVREI